MHIYPCLDLHRLIQYVYVSIELELPHLIEHVINGCGRLIGFEDETVSTATPANIDTVRDTQSGHDMIRIKEDPYLNKAMRTFFVPRYDMNSMELTTQESMRT
jgi:hypothetical protein